MKAVALAASARQRGNCYDCAEFVLNLLAAQGVTTELINFDDYRIMPCQHCAYECLEHCDPRKGVDAPCPIHDDVRPIWEKTWASEILFLFVPTYGGMPPALWLAFSQRAQAFFRQAPRERLKKSVVSAVVFASPHQSGGASWIPSFMSDEVKGLERKVVGFEVINHAQFETEYIFDRLINEQEVQRRLEFMTKRTFQVVQELIGGQA
jgi:multimeric flavodoxin WrbA